MKIEFAKLTQRHVDNGTSNSTLGNDIIDSPVEAGENGRGAGLTTLKDLDGDDTGLWMVRWLV